LCEFNQQRRENLRRRSLRYDRRGARVVCTSPIVDHCVNTEEQPVVNDCPEPSFISGFCPSVTPTLENALPSWWPKEEVKIREQSINPKPAASVPYWQS
jgi:hypothetical protein